jgi:branched-chain amino acid aminotransferase
MSFPKSELIWMNGKLVPWDEAKIHIGSHVIHYGSAVFEGIRCYSTPEGPAVFRLDAHSDRLYASAKIYGMDPPVGAAAFNQAILETIAANHMDACYIRPLIYRGYGQLGVNPLPCPVDMTIMVWDWGKYLGAEALEKGVDVRVSSWTRIAPNTLPAMAKTSANYMNSQLIKMEALRDGYSEGIALDAAGYLSEGSGENLFIVKNGKLLTPALASSVLPGITRDSVMTLARRLGVPVAEEMLPREMLYVADEVFFTGTAAGITVGKGARGPVTEALQKAFFDVIECRAPDEFCWLTSVREVGVAAAPAARKSSG